MIRRRISVAFFLWVLSFLMLFYTTEAFVHPAAFLSLLVPVLLFLTLNEKVSFLLFIVFTIVSSSVILCMAFVFEWSTYTQMEWISLHALVLVNLWSVYVLAKWSATLARNNDQLRRKVNELEEYIADTQILSRREFDKQKEIILTSMIRKRESGYLVYVGLENLPPTVKKTSFVKLSDIIYLSVRKYFDIVGKYDEETIVFLLQNTNEEGLEVVINRIESQLEGMYTATALSNLEWTYDEVGFKELPEVSGESRS